MNIRSACANYICSQRGCQGWCLRDLYSDWPARPCVPTVPVHHQTVPMGCICPPTSEQTCRAPMCPRKPWPASGIEARSDETRSGSAEGESPAPEGGDAR